MNGLKKWISPLFFTAALWVTAGILAGCGSSGGSDAGTASSEKGDVVISLTDAEGDFEKYEVDIQSILLTRKNGDKVETLPMTTRIDFAQYVDLEEIVTTATIPLGAYTDAAMVLDYTNADIQVEVGGVSTPAVVKDSNGNPVTTLTVTVKLDTHRPLVIAPGVPGHLSLDFDLKATNAVDTVVIPPVVTVEPVLIADVNPDFDDLKRHRVRGPLVEIDKDEESFRLGIRPFHHRIHRDGRHFGQIKVVTHSETVYEVDGLTGEGSEGFALLAEKPLLTAVVVWGELNIKKRVFEAREVLAGSSVPGGEYDAVRGSVISRSGDTLTVHGAVLLRGEGEVVLSRNVTVLLSERTKVTKQGGHGHESDDVHDDDDDDHEKNKGPKKDKHPKHEPESLDKDDISVGQRITVFGAVSGTESEGLTIDATEGLVRMLYTTVAGTVNAVRPEAQELTMDLSTIDGRAIELFNFTGTGSDPSTYIVATGKLMLEDVAVGEPIRLKGHVAPFGATPPDFLTRTVMEVNGVNAVMAIHWVPATKSPFLSSSQSGLEIDLTGVGRLHHVFRSHFAAELKPEPAPYVLPRSEGRGKYAIRQGHTISVHSDFGDFVNDLNRRLDEEGVALADLHAKGRYTGLTQTMVAKKVTIGLR